MSLDNKIGGEKFWAFEINNVMKAIRQLFQNVIDLNASTEKGVVASDVLRASMDSEKTSAYNVTPALLKKFKIRRTGTIRIKYDVKSANQNYNCTVYLQNDGAQFGQQYPSSSTYATYSVDVTVYSGDVIELYGYGNSGGNTCAYVKNLRVYFSYVDLSDSDFKIITD